MHAHEDDVKLRSDCPYCGAPVDRTYIFKDRIEWWWYCTGCGRYFAPPWLDKDWEEPASEPFPPELVLHETPAEPNRNEKVEALVAAVKLPAIVAVSLATSAASLFILINVMLKRTVIALFFTVI